MGDAGLAQKGFIWGRLKSCKMCDGPIENFECIWVNIWCMVDWIWSQNCRNTLLLDTAGQLVWSTKKKKNGTLFVYPTGDQT